MSIMYCEKHDRRWDSDKLEDCPMCEAEPVVGDVEGLTTSGGYMEAGKLDEYLKHADDQMKLSNGHSFVTMLKTRCQYCGRSPASMGRCPDWFKTFIDNFKLILRENGEILEQVAPTASHDSQS